MKHLIAFFLLSAILFSGSAFAQDPLKEMRSNVKETINGQEYYIHVVKKGQTLYMISKAYAVEVNDVIRENPEVREGITAGMKLRIPVPQGEETPKKTPRHQAEPTRAKEKEEVKPAPEPPEAVLPCGEDKSVRNKTYTVALMLPLLLDEVEKMDVVSPPDDPESLYPPLKFIQFYEGFLIALDSLSKIGVKVKVYVYDVDKDTVKTKKMLHGPEVKNFDLIIGLLYQKNFQIVADFAAKNGISIVNPLSEREQLVKGNPHVFKVMPSASGLQSNLVSFLTGNFRESKIIIINPPEYPGKEDAQNLKKNCLSEKMDAVIADNCAGAAELMSKDVENVLVVYSANRASALDLITKLSEKKNEEKLTVVGVPRWDNFDDLGTDYLVSLKTHMFAPYFVDYGDADVLKFLRKYQARYQGIPDDLAFQGFDNAFYFITALNRYGKNIEKCIPELKMKSLQTSFRFSRTNGNGFVNEYWSVYKYENYRMTGVAH